MASASEDLEGRLATHVDGTCRWIKLAELVLDGELACVDGRESGCVVGTPGGTTGELVLALAAAEALTGAALSGDEVRRLLTRYVDAFGRFYQHTDDHVVAGIAEALGVADGWALLLDPPPALRPRLLELLIRPEHVGCGHLRSMLVDPAVYGVWVGLVEAVIRSFYVLLWDGGADLRCARLEGAHDEEAVVQVHVCGGMYPHSRVPMVAPSRGPSQVFVHHPGVLGWIRRQSARFVAAELHLDEERLFDRIEALGARQLEATLSRLAPGLPVYEATFCGDQVQLRARA